MDLENNWWCFSLQPPFTSWKTITRPLFPKLNKPSFISLFSQVEFSKLFHCSCSSFNFFIPFKGLASKIRHSPWNPAAAQSDININTLQEGMYPGLFCIFSRFFFFFPIVSYSVCGSAQAPGPFLEYPISVMKLWGILNAFLGCDTTEVLRNGVEMKVEKLYLVQHKGTYVIFFISVNSLLKRLGFSIKDLILFRNIYYNIISIL